ncbi:MAG: hypothetical protein CSA62_12300 [Planctomycetota bacterium]|nr:MAG: hypothetical protein CSA62_12300 [Planctomycetota bacterium]
MHGYLSLFRLRLLPSAFCDVLAGVAIAGSLSEAPLPRLFLVLAASGLLYASGMAWNDIADVKRDRALHRREKALVQGSASLAVASILAVCCSGLGLGLLLWQGLGLHGSILLGCILLYDFVGTRIAPFGLLLLPLCRMLNIALGMQVCAAPGFDPFTLLQTHPPEAENALFLLLCYGVYVGLAVAHGRLEDQQQPSYRSSRLLLRLAGLSLLLTSIFSASPSFAIAAALPMLFSIGFHDGKTQGTTPPPMGAGTGVLLRGLSQFGVVLALGAGDLWAAAISTLLAYALPRILRLSAARLT